MNIIDILISFLLNGVLILIFRSIIEASHNRDMARIESENQKNLSQLNAQLDQSNKIRQMQFTSLHEKRAKVIAELYKLLAQGERQLTRANYVDFMHLGTPAWLGGDNSKTEKTTDLSRVIKSLEPINQAIYTLVSYYYENKIFLTNSQVNLMDEIIAIVEALRASITMKAFNNIQRSEDEYSMDIADAIIKKGLSNALSSYQEVYPKIKIELETEFRKILGFDIVN